MRIMQTSREAPALDQMRQQLERDQIVRRIWQGDYTVWNPAPDEISNRLGWLTAPRGMQEGLDHILRFAHQVREDGYSAVVLLGMGGSSLAPETLSQTFGETGGGLPVHVLDSTHPGAISELSANLDPRTTLFLVSSKSGTTTETLSFFRFFHHRLVEELGAEKAGAHFAAITDPGSPLVQVARDAGFREVFLNDPNIGGRYAALSLFGLVPGGLLGLDLPALLSRAAAMADRCAIESPLAENPGAELGAVIAAWATAGRDKLTFAVPGRIAAFADWVEQLLAESLGKCGRGILPVVREPLGKPDDYGTDRLFVQVNLEGDDADDTGLLSALEEAGHPCLRLTVASTQEIADLFFLWEFATAVIGHLLGVQPFDQPDVESAKRLARELLSKADLRGSLPASPVTVSGPEEVVSFVDTAEEAGDYVAIQAYVAPSEAFSEEMIRLRTTIRARTRAATTFGYGPRFLHSTGQLHKGDRGNGLFVQLVDEPAREPVIPAVSGSPEVPFALLVRAQAAGDARALHSRGRRIVTLNLGERPLDGAARLTRLFGSSNANRT